MKPVKLFLPILAILLAFSTCKKDDDPNVQTSEWDFEVTFTITDPDVYSFEALGVALIETTETTYKVTADYVIGGIEYVDIVIEGTITSGKLDFTDKVIEILFQNGDVEFTEYITFSLPDVTLNGNTASGTGDFVMERDDTTMVESGTFDFEASKK